MKMSKLYQSNGINGQVTLDTMRVAILYQDSPPPAIDGVRKPMKPGGYSDSGADIAFNLRQKGITVVTPEELANPAHALDWVFPDTFEGINHALSRGAEVLWANTVLFEGHPLQQVLGQVKVVGQDPQSVNQFDDKWATNQLLKNKGLPVASSIQVGVEAENLDATELGFPLPVILKPVRGRGSQGVTRVATIEELHAVGKALLAEYGGRLLVEEFLPGTEATLSVMPPGHYTNGQYNQHWCLPAVARFNHQEGVAPYNGVVAVVNNSRIITENDPEWEAAQKAAVFCEQAAFLVRAKAPIRIDCRAGSDGIFRLFDLNMKPNLTGPGRPHREDQDSLTSLAARAVGWDYRQLLLNMLAQAW